MKNFELATTREFNGVEFRCYQDGSNVKDFWGTREQIGQLLEYSNPRDSIAKIHQRNQGRLDKFSGVVKLSTPNGGTQATTVYSFKGLLEICRYSNQPKADAVMDFLYDIADEIRKTGSYGAKNKTVELQERRVKVMEKNADNRRAQLILKGMEAFKDVMTPESKAVFMATYAELTSGQDMKQLMPAAAEKWYSATEIGEMFGVNKNTIGSLANKNAIKAPEGHSNKYGTWIRSKSRYSDKEVLQWVYFEPAVEWFKTHLRN
ncbi:MAG: hypothetical protein IJ859_08810 [Synergistaceae bacterium]|nr:hypothetical protein [Synergistaceae bacterium]